MQCEKKFKIIETRHEDLKSAIAAQEAKLTVQGELKKLKAHKFTEPEIAATPGLYGQAGNSGRGRAFKTRPLSTLVKDKNQA